MHLAWWLGLGWPCDPSGAAEAAGDVAAEQRFLRHSQWWLAYSDHHHDHEVVWQQQQHCHPSLPPRRLPEYKRGGATAPRHGTEIEISWFVLPAEGRVPIMQLQCAVISHVCSLEAQQGDLE